MSNDTLETIRNYISDALGIELIRTYDKRASGAAFIINFDDNTTRIFISEKFVIFIEQSNDIDDTLNQFDIINFIMKHPGQNLFLGSDDGIKIDSINS
ncbi:hypothetical protein ACFL1N_16290 [Thermodesulfobacteriota bacterium]